MGQSIGLFVAVRKGISPAVRSAVVLLSGGLDSAVLAAYAKARLGVGELHALTFLYGQKHAREAGCARIQALACGAASHVVVPMEWFAGLIAGASGLTDAAVPVPDLAELGEEESRQPPTYVPNRNMVFLAIAAARAEAAGCGDVLYGAQAHDRYGYWDCTPEFVAGLNSVLALNRRRAVKVAAPFATMRKAEVVRLGAELGVSFADTWSCYRGGERPCGRCPTCVERAAAFAEAGVSDPVV
jgi:7-cyano-7-deazaguanine synthase